MKPDDHSTGWRQMLRDLSAGELLASTGQVFGAVGGRGGP
jgi:hypothetical protein